MLNFSGFTVSSHYHKMELLGLIITFFRWPVTSVVAGRVRCLADVGHLLAIRVHWLTDVAVTFSQSGGEGQSAGRRDESVA